MQNKDPQQATSTEEEDTDVGGEVQPEPEMTQNEDPQQESPTEEDVASEMQSVRIYLRFNKHKNLEDLIEQ